MFQGSQNSQGAPPFPAIPRVAQEAAALGTELAATETEEATDLELLADHELFAAMWSFIHGFALRQEDCGHVDVAGLCPYRRLELIPQRRLALRALGAGRPDYGMFGLDESAMEQVFAGAQPAGIE